MESKGISCRCWCITQRGLQNRADLSRHVTCLFCLRLAISTKTNNNKWQSARIIEARRQVGRAKQEPEATRRKGHEFYDSGGDGETCKAAQGRASHHKKSLPDLHFLNSSNSWEQSLKAAPTYHGDLCLPASFRTWWGGLVYPPIFPLPTKSRKWALLALRPPCMVRGAVGLGMPVAGPKPRLPLASGNGSSLPSPGNNPLLLLNKANILNSAHWAF